MSPLEHSRAGTQRPAGRLLTRKQSVALLNENGFPISMSLMNKLCMPSLDEGPRPEGRVGEEPPLRSGQGAPLGAIALPRPDP
jgi:hypothetical protein